MSCVRITTNGKTYISHDPACRGWFQILLCRFFVDEEKREHQHRHDHYHNHHRHPYGDPDGK